MIGANLFLYEEEKKCLKKMTLKNEIEEWNQRMERKNERNISIESRCWFDNYIEIYIYEHKRTQNKNRGDAVIDSSFDYVAICVFFD